jgi:hypothetical protein
MNDHIDKLLLLTYQLIYILFTSGEASKNHGGCGIVPLLSGTGGALVFGELLWLLSCLVDKKVTNNQSFCVTQKKWKLLPHT